MWFDILRGTAARQEAEKRGMERMLEEEEAKRSSTSDRDSPS
jgi:hypothetical protein